ncbi:hypothetical protein EMIT043CA1_200091 [Pseudomonas brassicacearum]
MTVGQTLARALHYLVSTVPMIPVQRRPLYARYPQYTASGLCPGQAPGRRQFTGSGPGSRG